MTMVSSASDAVLVLLRAHVQNNQLQIGETSERKRCIDFLSLYGFSLLAYGIAVQ